MKSWHAFALMALGVMYPAGVLALQVDGILDTIPCESCGVEVLHERTVGEPGGPAAVGPITAIAELEDGRILLAYSPVSGEMLAFSPDLQAMRQVGRAGEGPGEYSFIRWIRAHGDQVHVFDAGAMRRTVLDSAFQVVSTDRFVGYPIGDVRPLPDGGFVLNGLIRTPDRIGYLLHVYDDKGVLERSFESNPAGFQPNSPEEGLWREIYVQPPDALWVAHRTRYQVDVWTTDGHHVSSLRRPADWFPPHDGIYEPVSPENPPLPRIVDLKLDREGLLWVMVRRASGGWADSIVPAGQGANPEIGTHVIEDINTAYDTVIEVFDPDTRSLLASSHVNDALVRFVGEDLAVSYAEDAAATPQLKFWRLSLHLRR